MNIITSTELEKAGLKPADLAAFADMPPAQQRSRRPVNHSVC